jgi:hypothetical protein
MRERSTTQHLQTRFFKHVLLPGVVGLTLYWVAETLPRPTSLDLLFYLLAIPCGVWAAVGGLLWLAKALAAKIQPANIQQPDNSPAPSLKPPPEAAKPESDSLYHFVDVTQHLELTVQGSHLTLQFYECDREPLRPQRFTISDTKLKKILESIAQGQAALVEDGSDKLWLSGSGARTSDRFGAHFEVKSDRLLEALTLALSQLRPSASSKLELRKILDDLHQGKRHRFDPSVIAGLTELREDPELDELVRPALKGNSDEALFAASFLFTRCSSKAEMIEPMLAIIEQAAPANYREAAESTLEQCFLANEKLITEDVLRRVVARIPWDNGPRAVGSALRPLQAAGKHRTRPFQAELAKHEPILAARLNSSRVPEEHTVLRQLQSLLAP